MDMRGFRLSALLGFWLLGTALSGCVTTVVQCSTQTPCDSYSNAHLEAATHLARSGDEERLVEVLSTWLQRSERPPLQQHPSGLWTSANDTSVQHVVLLLSPEAHAIAQTREGIRGWMSVVGLLGEGWIPAISLRPASLPPNGFRLRYQNEKGAPLELTLHGEKTLPVAISTALESAGWTPTPDQSSAAWSYKPAPAP